MTVTTDYAQPIEDALIKLFVDNLGEDLFKTFFGDPITVGQSQLPLLCVDVIATDYPDNPATGMVKQRHTVRIILLASSKDHLNKNPGEVTGKRWLRNIMEGNDPTTGELSAYSILGVLRKNFTITNTTVNQIDRVQYTIDPKDPTMLQAIATVTFDRLFTVTGIN